MILELTRKAVYVDHFLKILRKAILCNVIVFLQKTVNKFYYYEPD